MAGYWPSSVFCVFMDRDEVEVHKLAKKERGQYSAILTEQTWSIKDLTSQAKTFRTVSRFKTDSRSPAVHLPFEWTGMPFERLVLDPF